MMQLVEEGRVKVHDLATQRRMRPEIADLIRPAVYPNLRDAPHVKGYPSVKGMRRNLFFWDHAVKEDEAGAVASSKTNRWGVRYILSSFEVLILAVESCGPYPRDFLEVYSLRVLGYTQCFRGLVLRVTRPILYYPTDFFRGLIRYYSTSGCTALSSVY